MTRRMDGFLGWKFKATTCACMLMFGCAQQPAATSAPASPAPVASTATSVSEAAGTAARADSTRASIDPGVLQALDRMGDAAFERRTRTGRTPGIFVVEYLDAKLDLLLNEVLPKLGRESHTVRIPAGAPWAMAHDHRDPTGKTLLGPAHRRCNGAENARRNNPKRAAKRARWAL